jgi:hypothetical protein
MTPLYQGKEDKSIIQDVLRYIPKRHFGDRRRLEAFKPGGTEAYKLLTEYVLVI